MKMQNETSLYDAIHEVEKYMVNQKLGKIVSHQGFNIYQKIIANNINTNVTEKDVMLKTQEIQRYIRDTGDTKTFQENQLYKHNFMNMKIKK